MYEISLDPFGPGDSLHDFIALFQAKDECAGKASQLFNAPLQCVVKEAMANQQICAKLQWYCDDAIAQGRIEIQL